MKIFLQGILRQIIHNKIIILFLILFIILIWFAEGIINWLIIDRIITNVLFRELSAIIIICLILTSIYNSNSFKNSTNYVVYDNYWFHLLFSITAIFLITLLSLLYTVYSDVFFQQGSPVQPIINGLNKNITIFDIDEKCKLTMTDTTDIILVMDISGSMNIAKNEIGNFNATVELVENKLNDEFEETSPIQDLLNKIKKENKTSNLVKLKSINLLFELRNKLRLSSQNFLISFCSFGKNSDFHSIKKNLKSNEEFNELIEKILLISPSLDQMSETDTEKLIEKINKFIDPKGEIDIFKRHKTVISIFSDFVNDSKKQKMKNLEHLISDISNKSIFFNLYYFGDLDTMKYFKNVYIMPLFKNLLLPDQLYLQNINDSIKIQLSRFKNPEHIEFVVNKNFNVFGETHLKIGNLRNVEIKLLSEKRDPWHQFRLNNNYVRYESLYSIGDNDIFTFQGHVPQQYPLINIDFVFTADNEIITSEIVFKKGLPRFVSRLMFTVLVLLIFISILYLAFLIYLIVFSYEFNKNTNYSKNTLKLVSDGINKGFAIPCKLDGIDFFVTVGVENTIPSSFVYDLYIKKKLKDKRSIRKTPFGNDEIEIGSEIYFSISILNSFKKNVIFTVVEFGSAVLISQELLNHLGFENIGNKGILQKKM